MFGKKMKQKVSNLNPAKGSFCGGSSLFHPSTKGNELFESGNYPQQNKLSSPLICKKSRCPVGPVIKLHIHIYHHNLCYSSKIYISIYNRQSTLLYWSFCTSCQHRRTLGAAVVAFSFVGFAVAVIYVPKHSAAHFTRSTFVCERLLTCLAFQAPAGVGDIC